MPPSWNTVPGNSCPPAAYDYYAGGAGRERTLRANEKAWQHIWLAPRVLRDVPAFRTGTQLLGTALATPVCVAPTAFHRLARPDGELASAAGAASGGAWWFQVYIMRNRDLTASTVTRAVTAGASALVLTGGRPWPGASAGTLAKALSRRPISWSTRARWLT